MTATHVFIFLTMLLWIAFDIYTVRVWGVGATISRAILAWHWRYPWVSFAVGILIGHLFFPQPAPRTD